MKQPVFLIVEHEAPLLRSLSRALAHLGAMVHTAKSAPEAERLLAGGNVDAVLVDLVPDLDPEGIDILSRSRAIAPRALRVLISGVRSARVSAALDSGIAEHFLAKPFGLGVITRIYEIVVAR